jgi:hypothetical protein
LRNARHLLGDACSCGLCSGQAMARHISSSSASTSMAAYDDNIDFARQNEIDATRLCLTPNLQLDGKTERWDLGVNLELPFERYPKIVSTPTTRTSRS